ncbi:MAG: DUF1232 domain-containing protein [Candidatus Cloacimonetes bacterium]|nr:DUF1232 domain-containing protein [Candidatus Cloacimonadota bacterium]
MEINDKEHIEEPDVEEINENDFNKIKEKLILGDDEKKFKFYEKLRRKTRKFMNDKIGSSGERIIDYLFLLPDFFMLLIRLTTDERVKKSLKFTVLGVIAYVILPIDIIPDFIPIIGYVDDLVMAIFALNMIMNEVGFQILLDNWSGPKDLLNTMQSITDLAYNSLNKPILKKIQNWLKKH